MEINKKGLSIRPERREDESCCVYWFRPDVNESGCFGGFYYECGSIHVFQSGNFGVDVVDYFVQLDFEFHAGESDLFCLARIFHYRDSVCVLAVYDWRLTGRVMAAPPALARGRHDKGGFYGFSVCRCVCIICIGFDPVFNFWFQPFLSTVLSLSLSGGVRFVFPPFEDLACY